MASACTTKVTSRSRKSRALGDDPQLVAQRARSGLDRAHRGRSRAAVGGQHADHDDERHRDPHHAVAGPATDRVPDHRSGRAGEHDREGEDRHPPGHQSGALVVRRGHLRGHRHVGHLEERVRRRAGQEADQHPGRLGRLRAHRRSCEQQREGDREREPGAQQPRPPRTTGVDGPVADPAGDRVQHHVPRLRHEHDEARRHRRDPEAVGEVGQQHQPRDRPERAGGHRAGAVAEPHRPRQARGGLHGGRLGERDGRGRFQRARLRELAEP